MRVLVECICGLFLLVCLLPGVSAKANLCANFTRCFACAQSVSCTWCPLNGTCNENEDKCASGIAVPIDCPCNDTSRFTCSYCLLAPNPKRCRWCSHENNTGICFSGENYPDYCADNNTFSDVCLAKPFKTWVITVVVVGCVGLIALPVLVTIIICKIFQKKSHTEETQHLQGSDTALIGHSSYRSYSTAS